MKQFYRQVHLDKTTKRFAAVCAGCGSRLESGRLSLLCRDRSHFADYESGDVGGIRQKLYNKSFSDSVQYLARFFNKCSDCGAWVCDDCFYPNESYGICRCCANKHQSASAAKQK